MSESTRAVFLSYASQDAEPVRRICGALRSAGIEVWFDRRAAGRRRLGAGGHRRYGFESHEVFGGS
jgi:hypothetical protein